MGLEGGLNPYSYAGNNPVMNVDPSGLDCIGGTCSTGFEQGMYDWWPGYKFGTGLYNSIFSGSNQFSFWEGFDAISLVGFGSAKGLQAADNFMYPIGISSLDMTSPTISRTILRESESSIINTKNFFEKSYYSDKVKYQTAFLNDYHSFPESVKTFASSEGRLSKIIGGDKLYRDKLEISGSYRGKSGVFEFIRNYNGEINHRLFVPNTK